MKDQKSRPKAEKSKYRQIFYFLSVFLIFNILFFIFPSSASAQNLSLSISPPLLEVLIKPGKSITQIFKLINNGEATVATVRLAQYSESGVKEFSDFIPENWISILNTDIALGKPFFLGSGDARQLILRVAPPKTTVEQDYYRVILITTTPNPPNEYSQSHISQTIGSILLLSVTSTGMLEKKAEIRTFSVPKFLDSFSPLEVTIDVKNAGKTKFRPLGTITLTGPVGRGSFAIDPQVFLAGQTRMLKVDNASSSLSTPFTLSLGGFFIGKYQIALDFTLDEGTTRVSDTKTFYAFPWKAGLAIFTISIILIMTGKGRKKKNG